MTLSTDSADASATRTGLKLWWPSTVMMLGTLLSYVDRASLALLSPMFLSATHMTAQEYRWCVSEFSFAYMFSALAWGSILDRIGLRLGMTISLFIWMVSSASHAAVGSFLGFAVARAALGIGEGSIFPGGFRTALDSLPVDKQARGVALATFAVCYVAAAGTPVALALARPHASLPDGSRVLARLAPPGGVVTGPYAESLAVASPLFPLWLSPKDPDKGRINRDARLADVDVVLEDPSRPGPFVRHDELGVPFRERATIPLFFDPLRGVPRMTVKAYVRERP
jgi:MFS family permease